VAVENGYLDLFELKTTLAGDGFSPSSSDDDYELAIESASRWIDERCSHQESGLVRHFWQESAPVARIFDSNTLTQVCCGDFDTTTGLVVATDDDGDGVFENVWDPDLWQPEPHVRINGFPYRRITTTGRIQQFPISGRRPNVQITAQWGWGAVPKPVIQACKILAVAYMQGLNIASSQDGFGGSPVTPADFAEHLLRPYLPEAELDALAEQLTMPAMPMPKRKAR